MDHNKATSIPIMLPTFIEHLSLGQRSRKKDYNKILLISFPMMMLMAIMARLCTFSVWGNMTRR